MFLFGGKYNNCRFRKEADPHERDSEKDRKTKSGYQQVGLMLYTLHVWDIIIASKLHRSFILVEVAFLKTAVHQVTCERKVESESELLSSLLPQPCFLALFQSYVKPLPQSLRPEVVFSVAWFCITFTISVIHSLNSC